MEIILVVGAYLVGSIPFGLLFGKLKGIDVRMAGSGNIGATNVGRLLGKGLAAVTLLADVAKAIVPMMIAGILLQQTANREMVVALTGAASFLGHLFPVYLKFQGGKGVATALGVFLYLTPLAALIDVALFIGVVYNWGYVSLGSLSAALLMPGLVWLLYGSRVYAGVAFFVGLLVWYKHRGNITRLMHGEEKSWKNGK